MTGSSSSTTGSCEQPFCLGGSLLDMAAKETVQGQDL